MYTKWAQIDLGLPLIVEEIFNIILKTHEFSTFKSKTPGNETNLRYNEFIDCIQLEFKGTAKLYSKIGCVKPNTITNMGEFALATQKINQLIIAEVIPLIKSKLVGYYPKINSEETFRIFNHYVDQYIYNKMIPICDVANRRFVLVIKK